MIVRRSIVTLAAAFTLAGIGTADAHAQGRQTAPGQLVQAVAKLNSAQLSLAKRLADDASFLQQFEAEVANGNTDAAAGLAASATGIAKASIHVRAESNPGAFGTSSSTGEYGPSFRLATLSRPRPYVTAVVVCFNLGIVKGCIVW